MVGDTVTNLVTGQTTVVLELIFDPPGTTDPAELAWVRTSDGYTILVKNQVDDIFYDGSTPPIAALVIASDPATAQIQFRQNDDPSAPVNPLDYALTNENYDDAYGATPPPVDPVDETGGDSTGKVYGGSARGGDNGHAGFFFVPPGDGHNGHGGPTISKINADSIVATSRFGIEAKSIGGHGGKGGNSIFSWWSPGDGGNGGTGGSINFTNNASITTSGVGNHGIFAYSRSGKAGNGGDGILAIGSGGGGAAPNGGAVFVVNNDDILTSGDEAHGVYALSQSGNGGTGGASWGLVGTSGSGAPGGNGGSVMVINNGSIETTGNIAHGIFAQSVGGTGGSAGPSGGLLAFSGAGEAGGSGGTVTVINNGGIVTGGNDSKGILAQSVGGGGGTGGSSGGLVALGGRGAGGGGSGLVTVFNNAAGSITTSGLRADAIFAQSVGGSGGGGGSSGGLVAVGGNGAIAGNGGAVTIVNFGRLTTEKDSARGIVAQSIGGGGGDGGSSGAMVAVGGSGAGGGDSSTVTITNSGSIITGGSDAPGIFAQSVGGGGGNGGSAGSVSAFVGVAVGGDGGKGGQGGDVDLTLQGVDTDTASFIHTAGDRSTGIFAQSVGGGGGNGGGAVQASAGFIGAASIAVGGKGNIAGGGGTVTLSPGTGGIGVIETNGNDATGVFLQSVGGGGGNGGFAVSVAASAGPASGSLSVGVGGHGGAGGDGGTVNVGIFDSNGILTTPGFNGSIVTRGERSTGFFAQSVGGGGGNGGLAVTAPISVSEGASASIGVAIGGDGAGGGAGGTVKVGTQGNITTEKAHSTGMLVQSVGGGGGNGGGTIDVGLAASGAAAGEVSVGIGGGGGAGSQGGTVRAATQSGLVTTSGENSSGIIVQSVGGGGGNGGYTVSAGVAGAGTAAGSIKVGLGGTGGSGGFGGTVVADLESDVVAFGDNSGGILVQSVGGGGGNGGFNVAVGGAAAGTGAGAVSVGLGGTGGAAGTGGAVVASSKGAIDTWGDRSSALVVQSIGGGGGSGGFNVSGTVAGAGTASGSVSVGLGGNGGGGGIAGSVTAANSGNITTRGDNATGILAQSVGGGGGNGGFNVSVAFAGAGTAAGSVGVGLGGSGAGGANGGTVDLLVDNDVTTIGNDSAAVIAQSVGGGGGNGGFNVSVTASGAGTAAGSVGVGLGGSGAGGGNGKRATSNMTGDIETGGDNATGLLVQSVGGGGGNGGFNVTVAGTGAGTAAGGASIGLGGGGGAGGDSGQVESTLTGNVSTLGDQSTAVIAQSLGGGGGNGGFNISGSLSVAKTAAGAASVGIGGSGGGGGDVLGTVTNTVTGNVTTLGEGSGGVLAQSLGGGGGNGGFNVSGTITASGTAAGAAAVGIGGSGGGGGNSSAVTNTVTGQVTTAGNNASGVVAQSLGGGGGNGGLNISGAVGITKTAAGAVAVGIGGSGGSGGDGAVVTNAFTGDVGTSGNDAYGVLAQSVGGGGGNGGLNISLGLSIAKSAAGAVGVGFGGTGGSGGISGEVTNNVTGFVSTEGERAGGVVTQSLGGGGGNGALNVSATLTAAKSGSGGLAVGVGGFGGDGKAGANATSTVTGSVATLGDNAPGILTQSLGGGGGNGGVNVSAAVNLTKENGGALGVGIGGFGAGGGAAGDVTSTVTATGGNLIHTTGDASHAVVAQSIGGGGGNGGVNVTGVLSATGKSGAAIGIGVGGFGGLAGVGGNVTLATTGDIVTEGNDANGLFAQSLGGGGGNGGVNVSAALNINKKGTGGSAAIGVGGFGGGGGDAGAVDVTYRGNIVAVPTDLEGPGSHGLVAQSLAGGGGNGAVNVSAGLAFSSTGEDGDGHALVIGIGGFGGGAGNAGAVNATVEQGSNITSFGDDRSAILAQSIGGGGGNGGVNVSAGIAADAPIVFGMGGFAGGGGQADSVTVDAAANLLATGKNAHGIFAQSIGGGGGNGGLNVSGAISYSKSTTPPALVFGMGGFGGTGNISSDVDVTHQGTITTSGADGHGIFAQSIAGGGGNGGLNVSAALIVSDKEDSGGFKDLSITAGLGGHGGGGADAGNTNVNSVGNITTAGDNARGIFAQSIGGGGGNGGMNFTGNVAQKSSLVTLGVGGFGAGGGNAGSAGVQRGDEGTAAGKITTNGTGAIGIESTSIGGGGGDAGLNLVASVSFAGKDGDGGGDGNGGNDSNNRPHPKHTGVDPEVFTNYDKVLDELEGRQKKDKEDEKQKDDESGFAVQVAIGGSGGGAGDGGVASVSNHGDVETLGQQSHGILAQSIGGGGGNAAMNIALTYFRGDAVNRGLNFALGGATGDGGAGDTVDVTHNGFLETHGADSFGIVAQSIGGGGGNASAFLNKSKGDVSKLDISIGRRGGSGGEGGDVSLSSAGSVVTHGDRSWGLIAQSIGNGGGNSSATTISGTLEGKKGAAARGASLSIGLEGGVGGSAGDVDLNASGLVSTEGTAAHAIFAQSVGGGGGNGGDASASSANASISLGGTGGTGGTGGAVVVTTSAEVRTLGQRAYGLIAQSIGGGGGTGGKSEAEVESTEPGLAISLGGTGGTGSVGAAVTVENSGVIITGGDESIGVFAQSLGGGGGTGGMSVTSLKTKKPEADAGSSDGGGSSGGSGGGGDNASAVQLAVNIGGAGGMGAAAADVRIINTGGVGTAGSAAPGIFAQSIGGGGGNASQVVSKFSGAGAKFNTGIGGVAGTGGTGGDVAVENLADEQGNAAQIITMGDSAHGIVAMSIGGGGGNGSTVVSENETENESSEDVFNTPRTLGVSMNVGGNGGSGGASGLVTVTNAGEIITQGAGAHGIFAQSIGGGGGNGGVTYKKDQGLKGINSSVDSSISIGGIGGDGNISGDVIVTNAGSIEVHGDGSYGVFAQSIGGGGGNGGMSGAAPAEDGDTSASNEPQPQAPSVLSFTLGGEGGDGADSGNVTVDHQGSIVSYGDNSYGIFAQSIAGGGGTAGATYSTLGGKAAEFFLPLLLGSRDGGTGTAGLVEVSTEGDITMLGANSQPFFAQSVNGGGGNVRLTLDVSNTELGQVNPGPDKPEDPVSAFITALVEVGSEAVENGLGAAIRSEHVGTLISLGKSAPASSTQSVGGGGGNADIDLTVNDDAVVDLEFLLGGTNSTGSGGGAIDFTQEGDVTTMGDLSKAVSVQSIGGGGGNLDFTLTTVAEPKSGVQANSASAIASPRSMASVVGYPLANSLMMADSHKLRGPSNVAAGDTNKTVTLSLGADGSTDNSGGAVNAAFTGNVFTEGAGSPGLVEQSIGAGGGDVRIDGADALSVTMGGTNGASGNGGDIALSLIGTVETQGTLSHGVVLQTIGGGGGVALTDLDEAAVGIELSGDNLGSGGAIDFTQTGDIVVTGDRSVALLAQSLGGGGGVVDRIFQGSAGGAGSAGPVTVSLDGSVFASGNRGMGVFVQSAGTDGQDNLRLTLGEEQQIQGGPEGAGVWFSGGRDNLLTNFGSISTADGTLGLAVHASGGANKVDNQGRILGNVDLGPGNNVFYNRKAALFAPGTTVQLGSPDNLLLNEGTLIPWDEGHAGRVILSGSFKQAETGMTVSEIDFETDANDVLISSGTADLGGTVDVTPINIRFIPVGEFEKDLFFAARGVTNSGMTLKTAPSVVVNYDLDFSPQAAELRYAIDFAPDGLGDNLRSIGEYINRGQQAGGGSQDYGRFIEKLVYEPDMTGYRYSLSQLSPELYAEHQVQLLDSGIEFAHRLMSCQQAGGEHRFTREGECMWLLWENEDHHLDNHGDYKAIDGSTKRVSLGGQTTLESDWTFGAGFSEERTHSNGYEDRWASIMHTYQFGFSAKRRRGASKFATVLSYAWSEADSKRRGALLDNFSTNTARDMRALTLTFRGQHDFESDSWFVRPKFDIGLTYLQADDAAETGLGGMNLVFEDYDETHTWIRPAAELGKEFEIGTDYRLRLNMEFGMRQYLSGNTTDVRARFAGAPGDIEPMAVAEDLGDPRYSGSIGVDLLTVHNVVLQLYYQERWSDHRDADSIRLKLQIPFH